MDVFSFPVETSWKYKAFVFACQEARVVPSLENERAVTDP